MNEHIVSGLIFYCFNCDATYNFEQLKVKVESYEQERDTIKYVCPSCGRLFARRDITILSTKEQKKEVE